MSVELLGKAVDACEALTQTVEAEHARIVAATHAATSAITEKILAVSERQFIVDGLLGNDENEGNFSAPFKTLNRALVACRGDASTVCKITIIRNGIHKGVFNFSGSALTKKIVIEAIENANVKVTRPDLGVKIILEGSYLTCETDCLFRNVSIEVNTTTHSLLCGHGVSVETYNCEVVKGAQGVSYFIANYSNPIGINQVVLQNTSFDGQGSDFLPVGKLSGTTLFRMQNVALENGAKLSPDYTSISDLYVY